MTKILNKTHHDVIVLKYEGYTYEQIAEAIKNRFTAGTLRNYFSKDGILYIQYLEYEAAQNKSRQSEARQIFERETANAAKVIIGALADAIKKKDHTKSVALAEKILDRGNIPVIRRIEGDDPRGERGISDEELDRSLERLGLNPKTGLVARKTKAEPGK